MPFRRFFNTEKQDLSRPVEGTMSFAVFLALCVLGLGFMFYAFFQWTYGDKRSALARQIAANKNALNERAPRPFPVADTRLQLNNNPQWHAGTEGPRQDRPSANFLRTSA